MSKEKTRHEHYVPQFYLDQFGEELYGFDKQTGNIFQTTSNNIAFEKGFYDIPNVDFESEIAKHESNFSKAIRELVEKKNPLAISDVSRIKVALFVALQYIRTKEYRNTLQETGSKLVTEMAKTRLGVKDLDYKIVMKDELAKALQAKSMLEDVPVVAWMLGSSIWTLLINHSKIPFWTSDNPVCLYNPIDYGDFGGLGLNVRGIQVHFPLNNELLLAILDPTGYPSTPIKISKPETVLYENKLQLYNAARFVYSSKTDFSEVKKLWNNDGNLRKTHERIIIRKVEGSPPPNFFIRKNIPAK